MKRAYRNPALARTVPSPTVRAPSVRDKAAARNASRGDVGRSAYLAPEDRAPFYSLWVFMLISISNTPGLIRSLLVVIGFYFFEWGRRPKDEVLMPHATF